MMVWSEQYDVPGIGLKLEIDKKKLYVQPDMDRNRYYWIVVWPMVKDKIDKKTGNTIRGHPQLKAWGTAPNKEAAKQAALERSRRRRPRAPGEPEVEEETLL